MSVARLRGQSIGEERSPLGDRYQYGMKRSVPLTEIRSQPWMFWFAAAGRTAETAVAMDPLAAVAMLSLSIVDVLPVVEL